MKEITNISVNSNLNVPLGQTVTPLSATVLTTDYVGNPVYEDGDLKYILNPEGYAVRRSTGDYSYNYYLKDHLGNNRVVLEIDKVNSLVNQATDYYPFGMPYADSQYPERQPYKFGGKEYDEMHGLNRYDFHARHLGTAIPIFTTPDPLAEKYYSVSLYVYALNNPVRFIDPTGEDIKIYYQDDNNKWQSWTFNGSNQDQAPENQFINNFLTAYNYNVENGGGDKLQEAAKTTDYTIGIMQTENHSSNQRTSNTGANTVFWNPNEGLETPQGTLSPATILEHEFDHSVEYETNYYNQLANKNASDSHFENKEEKRVITGSEYKTGVANGELQPIQKGREKYDSSYRSHGLGKNTFVRVTSPTTNKKKK